MFNKKNIRDKTDEELMLLICHKNEPAFTELYDRYAQRLLRFFYRMLNNHYDKAQDMLQELCIKLIENAHKYDTTRPFTPWVYTLAANMCRNEIKITQNRQRITKVAYANQPVAQNSVAATQLDRLLFKESYHTLFDDLEEEQKLLLTLHFQQDMPLKDIAVVLGIPEGTSRSRLFYLLKKFSVLLNEFDPKK